MWKYVEEVLYVDAYEKKFFIFIETLNWLASFAKIKFIHKNVTILTSAT